MTKKEYMKSVNEDFSSDGERYQKGSLFLHRNGWLTYEHALILIRAAHRYEAIQDPIPYMKAIRCTLIALGFRPSWVNGSFRTLLEDEYESY